MKPTVARFLLSFFGFGYVPYGAGTTASLLAATFLYVLFPFFPDSVVIKIIFFVTAVALLLATYVMAFQVVPEEGSRDPRWVVLDEIMAILLLAIPLYFSWYSSLMFVISIALFGLLDWSKPWVIGKIDAIHSPLGIMLDDVVAALTAITLGVVVHTLYINAIV